jgi:alkylation response protein AidB-like acyl-CoA dehydrogenase
MQPNGVRRQGEVMDFLQSESQRTLRDSIRTLGEKIATVRCDRAEDLGTAGPGLRRILAGAGLWGSFRPTACGERECSATETAVIFEEMARLSPLAALALAEHNLLSVRHLERVGDSYQRERWLGPSAQAPTLGSWCPADAISANGQVLSVTCAEKRGQGWILNGAKTALANGSLAEWTIVTAITDASAGKERLSSFILEKEMAGVRWEDWGKDRDPEKRVRARLVLEDVHAPAVHKLGREGDAVEHALTVLIGSSGCFAALCLGLSASALDACAIQARKKASRVTSEDMAALATRLTELETAWLLTTRAAFVEDRALGQIEESDAACARAVEVALDSIALAARLAPSKKDGRKGPSPLERSSAVIKRWLLTRRALESLRRGDASCTEAGLERRSGRDEGTRVISPEPDKK